MPVVVQMETVECGAACLSMILAYHGKWLSLEQLRTDCGISRDGSNARNLVLAARLYGLDAHGYRADISHLEGMTPAIIHWKPYHLWSSGIQGRIGFLNGEPLGSIAVSMADFQPFIYGVA